MKLKDLRESYYYHSGKASDVSRQLGFAGIALIWMFKTDLGDKTAVPSQLLRAAALISIALSLDLLHYLVSAATWASYNKIKEKAQTAPDAEFEAPDELNWAPVILFWVKVTAMAGAYAGFILPFLLKRFSD